MVREELYSLAIETFKKFIFYLSLLRLIEMSEEKEIKIKNKNFYFIFL